MINQYTEDLRAMESMTLAVCPMCGKEHKKYIYWTGSCTPRYYCDACYRQLSGTIGDIHGYILDK